MTTSHASDLSHRRTRWPANSSAAAETLSLRLVEKLSAAAAKFSLELDFRKLFQLIVEECAEVLAAERAVIWSVVDGRLRREAWTPASDMHWPPAENIADDGLLCVPPFGVGLVSRAHWKYSAAAK